MLPTRLLTLLDKSFYDTIFARGNVFNTSDTIFLCWKSIAAEVDTAMIFIILKDLPCHTVYSKLSGWSNCDGTVVPEFVWVLDPINGTPSGLLPTFGTLIAVLHNGKPVIGWINNPIAGIKTVGRRDCITTRNGVHVRSRVCENLGQAYVDIKDPDYNKDAKVAYVVVDSAVDPCSFLGLIPMVEGAGGIITDWQGNQLSWQPSPASSIPKDGFNVVASADPRMHQQIISQIS
ncbi:bifunctional phosphatase IMPL2, chloroplastic-like [Solanum verrucosum]|uniref:bifunctional phosphatase IMPL2, chloroplastic-like n=1 Tax=Solanum verrucosum TaxID=315347 RepID=UPI0020D02012|nr:bifunctional phosphatase IMPL2, chloroplastic-like [Solanum verrucosum]